MHFLYFTGVGVLRVMITESRYYRQQYLQVSNGSICDTLNYFVRNLEKWGWYSFEHVAFGNRDVQVRSDTKIGLRNVGSSLSL